MQRLSDIKISRLLLIACFAAYTVTTTVKMCVPTVISAMVDENFLNKSQSGLLSGIFYLAYGIGQWIFGKYFNTHKPFMGIKIALFGSAVCCALMSVTDNFYLLLLIWVSCAVVNSGFFSALMKIVSYMLCDTHSIWAKKYLIISYQAGTALCLLSGGFIMKYLGWVKLYYFAAIIAVVCLLYWCIAEFAAKQSVGDSNYIIINTLDNDTETVKKPIKDYIGTGVFCIFAVSFLNALLGSVKSWAPTIIMETYGTTPSFSVMLNVIILATNILFLIIIGKIVSRNEVRSLMIWFIISLPIIILMNFTSLYNEYVYVILLGIFTSVCAYASNVTAIQIPLYFNKYNDVSRICGISNMTASFALLIGNYAYGVLADKFGWQIIMILCVMFVVLSILLLMIALPKFKKFIKL